MSITSKTRVWYSGVLHHAYRFVLLTIRESRQADLVFYARRAIDLDDQSRHFALTPADFATLNPNTRTCPTFRSQRDANINLAIYRRAGVLWHEGDPEGNPWGLKFLSMFHMANDSGTVSNEGRAGVCGGGVLHSGRFEQTSAVMFASVRGEDDPPTSITDSEPMRGRATLRRTKGKLPELDHVAHADPGWVTLPRILGS